MGKVQRRHPDMELSLHGSIGLDGSIQAPRPRPEPESVKISEDGRLFIGEQEINLDNISPHGQVYETIGSSG